ncbi:MAG TPA: hypothetical protein VHV57_10990 [Acidimicrobiales bacterium]|nr:hypothetical protein [Acidimicrobiales bacterium]
MTTRHRCSSAQASSEKGAIVHALAETKTHVDFLQATPALSGCSEGVLQEFILHGEAEQHVGAGKHLHPSADSDQRTFVLLSGSGLLASHDVVVTLEPGDYFGGDTRFHMSATMVALSNVVLVGITPLQTARLRQASSRDRHPSRIDWRSEYPVAPRRRLTQDDRLSVLAVQSV